MTQANSKTASPAAKTSAPKAKTATSTANANQKNGKTLLRKFFVDSIRDLYWAEKHLTKTLPKMVKAATTAKLGKAFEDHLTVTEKHVSLLEEVFDALGETARAKKCEAMEGITAEGQSIIDDTPEGTFTRDVGLIVAAQKVEHYEIASYGCLVQLAHTLQEDSIAKILEGILTEEKEADRILSWIAEKTINVESSKEDRA